MSDWSQLADHTHLNMAVLVYEAEAEEVRKDLRDVVDDGRDAKDRWSSTKIL